ncbi:amidohydrolase family protein [Neotabrizicola sp. VNH66]|uniref:amidohydrolase family protein n=1 Tax=Neotabrizicola sp. VNH66 TaxID=3400918 RepID=UPI003C07FE16
MTDLLIRNVRPNDAAPADILITGGRIAAIGPGLVAPAGTPVHDGQGAIAIPPFVEAHVHLDKILWGLPWHPINVPAGLRAMIDNEVEIRKNLPWSVMDRAGRLMRQCVAMGSTHIRSHIDISTFYKLDNLHGVLAAWEKMKDAVGLELVAFPQTGMMIDPGCADLMEAALDEGASVIGGIDPGKIDGDPKGHLDTIFAIADRKGAKIDIHLHEGGELGLYEMGLICDRTEALGMQGRVIVSHAFCLGDGPASGVSAMIDRLAALQIGIISAVPGEIAFPPMFDLAAKGVPCALASDSIRDTWNPHGDGDMLDRCWLFSYRNWCRTDAELIRCLDMGTTRGGALLDLPGYGLAPGCEGSLVLIRGENRAQILVDRPTRAAVIKSGRIVAEAGRYTGPGAAA